MALALLAVVLMEPICEANCDNLPPSATLRVGDGTRNADPDACSATCVPDCYCCSHSLPARALLPVRAPDAFCLRPPPLIDDLAEGFAILVFRPPIPQA